MHAPTVAVNADTQPLRGAEAQSHSSAHSSIDALSRATLAGFIASLTMLLTFLVAFNLARLLGAAPIPMWPSLERPSMIHPASWVTVNGGTDIAPGTAPFWASVLDLPRLWLVNLSHNSLIDAGLSEV